MRNLNIVPANKEYCVHVALVDDGAALVVVTKVVAWKVDDCETDGDNEAESSPITFSYGTQISLNFDFVIDENFAILDRDGEIVDISSDSLLCAIQTVCAILSVSGQVWRSEDGKLKKMKFDRVICAPVGVDITCSK